MTVEERLALLEQRLRRAEDELAIARLMASYGPLADAGDADAVAGLWAEDGEYDVDGWHMRSRADIAEMVRSPAHQGLISGGSAHFLGPVHIDVAGDEAVAVCESILVRHNEDGGEGASVVVAERDESTGRAVAEAVGGLFGHVDVAVCDEVETAVAQAVSAYGSIDIVVNNAWGGGSIGRVENKTDQQLSDGIAVGYYGPFWAMRAALPHMRARGWGRVINVCSLNGVNAHMGTLEYNAAKEALRALTRTAAREWAPFGVTVNAICPAAKSAAFMRALGDNPEVAAFADAMNPMGRIGDPYLDIAPVVLFLAGEGCRYLTGNTLFVDGGSHINGVAWTPDLDAAP
jgi:NAD(P)-dependent dehydrogenase (short-subunit alcohol dehydrogenase family)